MRFRNRADFRLRISVLISVTLLQVAGKLVAQPLGDTLAQLQSLMARYTDSAPGAQIAISRHGTLIYSSARGMANLETATPMTVRSLTEAGSVSKQFTAAAILLLEQQGRLSVDDDIRKYFPTLPDYGSTITIRHLLHHTSGLKDWGSIAAMTGWPRGTRSYSNEDALQFILRQPNLNNPPGKEYIYSNSNYTLLTWIVQKVSRQSHAEFTRQQIFSPAGMRRTQWRDQQARVVPGRATAYTKSGGTYYTYMPNEDTYGHGGLLTTAEELLMWTAYWTSGKFGNPALSAKQVVVRPLTDGSPNIYAAGLMIDSVNGQACIYHSGATAAYRANLEFFPELGLAIAWLSNTSAPGGFDIAYEARNLFVPPLSRTATTLRPDSTIDIKSFHGWAGSYRNPVSGGGLRLYLKDQQLYNSANQSPLQPYTRNLLLAGRAQVLLHPERPGNLSFISSNGDTTHLQKVDPPLSDSNGLKQYTGTYYSEATGSFSTIEYSGGQLRLSYRPVGKENLTPIYLDGFDLDSGELYFQRDAKGRPDTYYFSVSRARKVEFRRVKQAGF